MIETALLKDSTITALARSYHILQDANSLRKIVACASSNNSLETISKPDLHSLINNILLEKYRGEAILKAKLVKLFINKKVTAAFEIKVNKSRVDFLTINGYTRSFEIKSELDNLKKLSKQIDDYEKVFDYNYIVVDGKHYDKAIAIVPERYGVMVLHENQLFEDRKGELNDLHDVKRQLSLFTKQEFKQAFRFQGITEEDILMNFTDQEINCFFKEMLKRRYSKRWSFLVDNKAKINAIDYQYFFQHNIEPALIYGISNRNPLLQF